MRPLRVAGVAGGVGTSTWSRAVQLEFRMPVADLGVYRGGGVDVLVTSNTAAAASRIGPALAACPRPPVLVVMHTVPGMVAGARSYLRAVEPHITQRLDVGHQRSWLEMQAAPGPRIPARARDVRDVLRALPQALQRMYPPAAQAAPGGPHPNPAPAPRQHTPAPGIAAARPAPARASPAAAPRRPPQPGMQAHYALSHRGG